MNAKHWMEAIVRAQLDYQKSLDRIVDAAFPTIYIGKP